MRLCPWLQAICGRWRRRTPLPKQTVDYFPTPPLKHRETRQLTHAELKELRRQMGAGRPGATMLTRDGTEYLVQRDGSWKRKDAARRN